MVHCGIRRKRDFVGHLSIQVSVSHIAGPRLGHLSRAVSVGRGHTKQFPRFLLLTTCVSGGNLDVSLKKEVVQKNEFL
jgi:hypothetical protein